MTSSPSPRLAAALLPLLALAACTNAPGGAASYDFQIGGTDLAAPLPFGTPLAAGLALEVEVFDTGEVHAPASFDEVQSHDPRIVRVTGYGQGTLTLEGQAPGSTQVDVISGASVKTVDTFDVTVADVARVDLTPPGPPPLKVVSGGVLHLGMTLSDATGARVVGYGAIPVAIAPADAGVAVASASLGVYQARFTALGDATITGRGAAPIPVTVVSSDAVAAVDVALANDTLGLGARTTAAVTGFDTDGAPIFGLSDVAVVTTSTPVVCRLAPDPAAGDDAYTITAIGHGTCTVDAVLGGVTASGSVEVP